MLCARIALQIGDKYRVTTPVNWKKGDDVIVHPSVTNEEAKTLFPEFTIHKASGCTSHTRSFAHKLFISRTSGPHPSRPIEIYRDGNLYTTKTLYYLLYSLS